MNTVVVVMMMKVAQKMKNTLYKQYSWTMINKHIHYSKTTNKKEK